MTCIVGLKFKGKVYIGADSCGSNLYDYSIRKDPKVFVNGDFIIGYTTSFRMGQLLMSKDISLRKQYDDEDDFKYLISEFIPYITKLFKDGGYLKVKDTVNIGGCFLFGYKGELYSVHDDFQIGLNNEEFDAVGCGANHALGALAILTEEKFDIPDKIINKALATSERFDSNVRGPFNIRSL